MRSCQQTGGKGGAPVAPRRRGAQGPPGCERRRPGVPLPGTLQSAESSLRSGVPKACKQARVDAWTPYGLRRLAVDTMIRARVDIATARAITGHSPEVMLRYYRQVTAQDKRRAPAIAGLREAPVEERKVIQFPGPG